MEQTYYITDKNDIYVFFEVVNQSQPDSILDIGMFLKRIGAVSRNVKNSKIPEDIILDGFTSKDEMIIPIYEEIYNNIFTKELPKQKYDLVFLIDPDGVLKEDKEKTITQLKDCSNHILTDINTFNKYKPLFLYKNSKELSSEDKIYYLLSV